MFPNIHQIKSSKQSKDNFTSDYSTIQQLSQEDEVRIQKFKKMKLNNPKLIRQSRTSPSVSSNTNTVTTATTGRTLNIKKIIKTSISNPASEASSSHSSLCYHYRIYPGNNTRVIINAFRRRKWWRSYSENVPSYHMIWEMYRNPKRYQTSKYKRVVLNHLQNNNCLVTKKGLYLSLRSYCRENNLDISTIVPLTFYLPDPSKVDENSDMNEFLEYNRHSDPESNSIWIMKPSYCSNRGYGIVVVRGYHEVLTKIGTIDGSTDPQEDDNNSLIQKPNTSTSTSTSSSSRKGWIVQSYLQSPLLISGRKFDIRCYVLLLLINDDFHAYYYQDGYIRTSSKRYHLNCLNDREIHLTNDAIQKKSKSYGKHENGNKLTYQELDSVLLSQNPEIFNEYPHGVVNSHFIPQIKRQIIHSIKATKEQLKSSTIKKSFELLGYDFMIDSSLQTYLIEINSNPCLEFACPMLEELINSMIEGVFQIAVDTICPPPTGCGIQENKWELLNIEEEN